MAFDTGSGKGPLLPMHVVHPDPTSSKPSLSRYGVSPAFARYSVTAFEPGARLVFTQGLRVRPFSTAFLARRPAAMRTLGFDVFVQLVMAAMTTEPCVRSAILPSTVTVTGLAAFAFILPSAAWKLAFDSVSFTRSCGRVGPARLGTTVPRSRCMVSEYLASGAPGSWKRPCSLKYASTSLT